MQNIFITVFLVCLTSCIGFSSQNSKNVDHSLVPSPRYRLPTTLFPTYYELNLFVVLDPLPNFQRFTATGEVLINVTCREPTNQIYLHAVNLTISQDSVRVNSRTDGSELGVISLTYELENDFFIITLNRTLQSDEFYGIYIKFVAPIPDYRLNGMYQDYYEDPESSETRYLATTLFAPYHARRLFPNFDEPSLRAEYSVAIGHHTKYHAMANEEIVATQSAGEDLPDYVWDYFRTTPSISSYITAMIISDFTYEEAEPVNFINRTSRVYASPHLISKGAGAYAANITDAVMGFFEDRFLIKFPLNKLYSIALPHFFFSAMENIGLITYKEPVLLYLKNETTEEERYKINYVMSHELAHQWFGNIVACKWWAYVWLKEGFATFYSHYGIEHTNPELNP
ncbi:unnamed protein product [Orchesella dallaii]|uniref:Aminopeptidase N n=1 Tax=Orchesella dallaii TaxID=48710 RepID=A0ABP1PYV2_9HEXA